MDKEYIFIEPEFEINPELEQPASYVRRSFLLQKDVKNAVILITALGVYKAYINGHEIDEQVLMPGYTDYNYRVQYQSYDITHLLLAGENVIAAVIGDGWYRGCIDIGSKRNCYGTKTKFMCCLEITYTDGTIEIIQSDKSFRASQDGELRENNIKTIERVDARKEMTGWNLPGYNDSHWHGVNVAAYEGKVIPQEGERILERERFAPWVLHTPDGNVILDFKQNLAGYIEFTVTGKSGHMVKLTMGEVLDKNGNFTMKNLTAEGASMISGEVGQKLEYTLKEGTQTYKPLFLVSGFRYALLENWPEEVKSRNFTAIAVYSDIRQVGDFSCSNELINRLVKNVRWSQKGNFVDIPGDCPTRERSGWTADISVFMETACYLSDPRKFIHKWLQDFKYEQSEDGNLPFVVPGEGKPIRQRGCMGWSDAIANIPFIMYQFYGDKKILEDVYDTVKRFVEFNIKRAKKRNPFFFYKRERHRNYIIETGFHYGEWLEPGRAMYKDYFKALLYPDTEVTTAWFYQTSSQLSQIAELLGKQEDAEKYAELAKKIKDAYNKEFVKNGRIHSKRQCRYVRPIAMDLVTEKEKVDIAEELNQMCIANEYKIGTGFLTTYKVLSVLTEYGYVDTAYKMLENTKQPGWLYPVTKGATTTWENWYGINEQGVPIDSHNHYAPGSVVAWLFSTCAGIRPLEPGFKKILIQPKPGGSLSYARAEYESCRGTIVSDWKIKSGKFELQVEVPEKTKATIIMPDGQQYEAGSGKKIYTCDL